MQCSSLWAQGQTLCGFDALRLASLNDPQYLQSYNQYENQVYEKILQMQQNNNQNPPMLVQQPNNYIIPVVFHLIGNAANTLTNADILNQLQELNLAFSNQYGSILAEADDAQITFCLAQFTPQILNNTDWTPYYINAPAGAPFVVMPGITRFNNNNHNTIASSHFMVPMTGLNSMTDLINIVNFNPQRYLNIWVVENISVNQSPYNPSILGYGTFPFAFSVLDGVVMQRSAIGNPVNPGTATNFDIGRVLSHEVGHYLGLLHTFEGACNEVITNTPCANAGDYCCDTPPASAQNQNNCIINNSCNENYFNIPNNDQNDMIENHMSYGFDPCRNTFTDDQVNRMHAQIQISRQMLVSAQNINFTGLSSPGGCVPNFISPAFNIFLTGTNTLAISGCPNQGFDFIAVNNPNLIYSWVFNGGIPNISNVFNPQNIVFANIGNYSITLTITDIVNNVTYTQTQQLHIIPCVPYTGANANWHFGNFCTMNFNNGIGQPNAYTEMFTIEASASVSTPGNPNELLFYTNGRQIWNNNHIVVKQNNLLNGSPNGAGWVSNYHGVAIVPRPGNANRYYIYTTSDSPPNCNMQNTYNGLSQYEVVVGPAPNYNITLLNVNPIHPLENYHTTESIQIVPHCNGIDYWLVVKTIVNTAPIPNIGPIPNAGPVANVANRIASYLIDGNGIGNKVPIWSESGPFVPPLICGNANTWITASTCSPNKKYIGIVDIITGLNIYYFDCSIGILNYLANIPGITQKPAFSPNSEILYAKDNLHLFQIDLSNLSVCNPNPPMSVMENLNVVVGSLKLGPDNKIYKTTNNLASTLDLIVYPDNLNTIGNNNNCLYIPQSIQFGQNMNGMPQQVRLDLPNDIEGTTDPLTADFKWCSNNCKDVCFANYGCGTVFTWDFGDGFTITGTNGDIPVGANNGLTSGNFEYPCHTYNTPDIYIVTLTIDNQNPVSHIINLLPPATPTITGQNPVCPGQTNLQYFAMPNGYNYSWTSTNPVATGSNQTFTITWTGFPATLSLTITDPLTQCESQPTIMIITEQQVIASANANPNFICTGSSVVLSASNICNNANNSVIWQPGNISGATITVSPNVTTTYTATVTDANNNTSTSVVTVTVVGNQNTLCCNPQLAAMAGNHYYYNANASSIAGAGFSNINTPIVIDGVFTIDVPAFTIQNCSNVRLGPNAEIVLLNNNTLNVLGSNLLASCDIMWKGILADNANESIVIQNSTIRHMLYGVDANNGAIINAQNSTFTDNNTGIRLRNSPTGYNVANGNCIIRNNTFNSTGNALLIPMQTQNKGEIGIYIEKCREVEIGALGITNINTFENLYTGIYSIPTSTASQAQILRINNNKYANIKNDIYPPPFSQYQIITNCYQTRRGAGIYIDGYDPAPAPGNFPGITHTLIVNNDNNTSNNTGFYNCDKAIVGQYVNAEIDKVRVVDTKMGLMFSSADNQYYKIGNVNATWVQPANLLFNTMIGIQLNGNIASNSFLYGNHITTQDVGMASGYNNYHFYPLGIELNHFGTYNNLYRIKQNNIVHRAISGKGISIKSGGNSSFIEENKIQFTFNNPGYNPTGMLPMPHIKAIELMYCNGTRVLENDLTGHPQFSLLVPQTLRKSSGIYMEESPNMTISCNNVDNFKEGFFVLGNCATGSQRVNRNTFYSHEYPILFRHLGNEGRLGNIGNITFNNENLYMESALNADGFRLYRITLCPFIIGESYFTNFSDPNQLQLGEMGNSAGNNPNCIYTINNCLGCNIPTACNTVVFNPQNIAPDNNEEGNQNINMLIATDSMQYSEYAFGADWLNKYRLYEQLDLDSLLLSSDIAYTNFYTQESQGVRADILHINQQIQTLNETIHTSDSSEWVTQWEQAMIENSAIQVENNIAENEQWINHLYMNIMRYGYNIVDSTILNDIYTLAYSCPFTEGLAVLKARTLYAHYAPGSDYNNIALCNAVGVYKNGGNDTQKGKQIKVKNIETKQVKVYPIPSSGNIMISYDIKQDATFIVYDATGRIIQKIELNAHANKMQINLQHLAKGGYVYKVYMQGIMTQAGKIILQ